MRIFLILVIFSFTTHNYSADKDQVYQNYLQRRIQASDLVFEYLPIGDLVNIVQEYNPCISYEQWQKNNQDLILGARFNLLEKVKQLLNEADVNAKNNFGNTALFWSVLEGHKEMVELLINAKADVNSKNDEDETPLMWAALKGHIEIVELLIAAKADINAMNIYGKKTLNWARDHKKIFEILRKEGAES